MIAGSVGVVQVYVLRKMASNRIQTELQVRCYVCSLSAHVVVYKVLTTCYSPTDFLHRTITTPLSHQHPDTGASTALTGPSRMLPRKTGGVISLMVSCKDYRCAVLGGNPLKLLPPDVMF